MSHDDLCEMALGIHQGAGPTCQCATMAYLREPIPGEEHPFGLRIIPTGAQRDPTR